jgi:hypothetical protein
MQQVK